MEITIKISAGECIGYRLAELTARLKASATFLAAAVAASGGTPPVPQKAIANMDPLQGLSDQVAETVGVEASAATLIRTLRQKLLDAGTDPVKLNALAASLKSSEDALSAAVAENPAPPA